MFNPLKGIKVLDFTHVLAGPACSYYLGLLGADIIKVELFQKGEFDEASKELLLKKLKRYEHFNAVQKRSIALDNNKRR